MLDAFDLTGRTVIVTGASRGIGRTTAEVLAAAGANVVAVARTESALHSLVQDIAGSGGKGWRCAPTRTCRKTRRCW